MKLLSYYCIDLIDLILLIKFLEIRLFGKNLGSNHQPQTNYIYYVVQGKDSTAATLSI